MSRDPDQPRERQISRDQQTIRQWADQHGAVPVRESGPEGGTDEFRLVPEEEVAGTHEEMEWDAFFDSIETGEHVVVYHGEEATEPFEITGQQEVLADADEDIENRLLEGETVTTQVTETRVVESVIVEEVTVDSELVGSEIVDFELVDAELLDREVMNVTVVEDEAMETRDWFDVDRYTTTLRERMMGREAPAPEPVERDAPFHVEFDVEERWAVTMDLVERYDVESHISDTDVTEADTLEDHQIDVEGLHRSIIESGVIHTQESTDDIMTRFDVESELAETDRITTSFTRERTVEDEVLDRKHFEADVTRGELLEMETVETREIESATAETTGTTEPAETAQPTESTEGAAGSTAPAGPMTVDENVLGRTVVDASGEEVGIVSDVHEDGTTISVDTHPGIADRIRTTLGWGEADEDDYPLSTDKIEEVTRDEIRLKPEEHLDEPGTGT